MRIGGQDDLAGSAQLRSLWTGHGHARERREVGVLRDHRGCMPKGCRRDPRVTPPRLSTRAELLVSKPRVARGRYPVDLEQRVDRAHARGRRKPGGAHLGCQRPEHTELELGGRGSPRQRARLGVSKGPSRLGCDEHRGVGDGQAHASSIKSPRTSERSASSSVSAPASRRRSRSVPEGIHRLRVARGARCQRPVPRARSTTRARPRGSPRPPSRLREPCLCVDADRSDPLIGRRRSQTRRRSLIVRRSRCRRA